MTRNEMIAAVLIFIAIVIFTAVVMNRADCIEKGGTYVRGVFGFECIRSDG